MCIGSGDNLKELATPFGGFFSCQTGNRNFKTLLKSKDIHIQEQNLSKKFPSLSMSYCLLSLPVLCRTFFSYRVLVLSFGSTLNPSSAIRSGSAFKIDTVTDSTNTLPDLFDTPSGNFRKRCAVIVVADNAPITARCNAINSWPNHSQHKIITKTNKVW